ncbi:MAG TPA: FAD-dependent monooxygenase [Roseiflexaceae bacterium]|nr:FAD-dependent monooxygenase [Roseiflexaceae bacterium]
MSTESTRDTRIDESTPVLIVGGSLVGLSTAVFLAWHGVRSLLVERHPSTAIHPRVASLTARTLELFQTVGLAPAIRGVEPAFSEDNVVPIMESLIGQEFDRAMEDMSAYFTAASPARGSLIAQDVLEPLLRAHAEQLGADLRYATELIAFDQDDAGISATIRERGSGATRTVRARYLVAADGGQSSIRAQLGIAQHGPGSLAHLISMIFEADLMELFRKRHAIMGIVNNDTISFGFLVPYDRSAGRPDVYRLDLAYDPNTETLADYGEARCLDLIRAAVGVPDLPVKLKTVLEWEMAARVSDRFGQGRVFLVGDAARVQPPTGALGGNTGIAEAHNLAWKLAAVLRGEAGEALLDTYDTERRPIAEITVEQVVLLSQERQSEQLALTVNTLIVNLGYRYQAGALLPEHNDDLLLIQDPLLWRGEPGTRAPHLVLERAGEQLSTLDLFGHHFVLLIGPEGQTWRAAARRVAAQLNIPLDIHQVGGELVDVGSRFCDTYGVNASGAVLVRPDDVIGWRAQTIGEDPERALAHALASLLCR